MMWHEHVRAILSEQMLQADQKAFFKLPETQREAIIKKLEPYITGLIQQGEKR